ncbi:MAG: hypothetical protein ACRDYC_07390 [Acidimicrobiales bacterium]
MVVVLQVTTSPTTTGTLPPTSTTTAVTGVEVPGYGSVVTASPALPGNPVPGAHNDPADLWGLAVAVVAIIVAIVVVRMVFRTRRPAR